MWGAFHVCVCVCVHVCVCVWVGVGVGVWVFSKTFEIHLFLCYSFMDFQNKTLFWIKSISRSVLYYSMALYTCNI